MTFVFTFFIIIRRRAIIECALVVLKTPIHHSQNAHVFAAEKVVVEGFGHRDVGYRLDFTVIMVINSCFFKYPVVFKRRAVADPGFKRRDL